MRQLTGFLVNQQKRIARLWVCVGRGVELCPHYRHVAILQFIRQGRTKTKVGKRFPTLSRNLRLDHFDRVRAE
jgi:hypothetical protein